MKYSVLELALKLQELVDARVNKLRNEIPALNDWPDAGCHIDPFAVDGAQQLAKEGRTPAEGLVASGLWQSFDKDANNRYYLFPKSSFMKDKEASTEHKKVYKAFTPLPRSEHTAEHMAALFDPAADDNVLTTKFQELGLMNDGGAVDWKQAKALLGGWRLVLVGPDALKWWRTHDKRDQPRQNVHLQGLCLCCSEAAVHGPCEHLYAALMHSKGNHILKNDVCLDGTRPVGRPKGSINAKKQGALLTPGSTPLVPGSNLKLTEPPAVLQDLRSPETQSTARLDPVVAQALRQLRLYSDKLAMDLAAKEVTCDVLKMLTATEICQFGFSLVQAANLKNMLQNTPRVPEVSPATINTARSPEPDEDVSQGLSKGRSCSRKRKQDHEAEHSKSKDRTLTTSHTRCHGVMAGTDPAVWRARSVSSTEKEQPPDNSCPSLQKDSLALLHGHTHDTLWALPWIKPTPDSSTTLSSLARQFGLQARDSHSLDFRDVSCRKKHERHCIESQAKPGQSSLFLHAPQNIYLSIKRCYYRVSTPVVDISAR
jgi:hypothetical protein